MDARSREILRRAVPEAWVVRDVTPDYGVDAILEVFDRGKPRIETLGEFLFLQIKSQAHFRKIKRALCERENSEKSTSNAGEATLEIDVAAISLDRELLENARLMGSSQPLILLLIDLDTEEILFLNLADYCDKILDPEGFFENVQRSKTVYVPLANSFESANAAEILRFFALRAKLYGMFGLVSFQHREIRNSGLEHLAGAPIERQLAELLRFFAMVRRFSDRLGSLPVWEQTKLWRLLVEERQRVALVSSSVDKARSLGIRASAEAKVEEMRSYAEAVCEAWSRFSLISVVFEDVVRHWWLPTVLGQLSSGDQRFLRPLSDEMKSEWVDGV